MDANTNTALTIRVGGDNALTTYDIDASTPAALLAGLGAIRKDPNATPQQKAAAGKVLQEFAGPIKNGLPLDVVIVFDYTTSMHSELAGCQDAVRDLIEAESASKDPQLTEWKSDTRIAFVGFSDIEADPTDRFKVLNYTSNSEPVLTALKNIKLRGGGPDVTGESALEGIAIALGKPLCDRIPNHLIENLNPSGSTVLQTRQGAQLIVFVITDDTFIELSARKLRTAYFNRTDITDGVRNANATLIVVCDPHSGGRDWQSVTQSTIDITTMRAGALRTSFANASKRSTITGAVKDAVAAGVAEKVGAVAVAAQKEALLMLTDGRAPAASRTSKTEASTSVIEL